MSKAFDFIQECGSFFLLTVNGDFSAGRPFGAIMEQGQDLYITTGDEKAVYRQMKQCGHVQLLAMKPGTRSWLRVTGVAQECFDLAVKARMLEQCPNLRKYHTSADEAHYNVFRVQVQDTEFY